jgi:hypothetical protein
MSKYFSAYLEDDGTKTVELEAPERTADPGGPVLPFDYLDSRSFEILACRLIAAEDPADNPVLMQGTGERGRDVIVYRNGTMRTIVQCKNYRDRLNAKQITRELLKLALHSYLEPTILPARTTYELWAPGGISENAEQLFADWPRTWSGPHLKDDTEHVIEKYAAFDDLEWNSVANFLHQEFPERVRPVRLTSIELSPRVRAKPEIYTSFFSGNVVMDSADVKKTIQELMVESGATALSDADVRRMIDRILSFGPDERLVFNATTLFGVSAELVAKFNRTEYVEFVEQAIGATFNIVNVLMKTYRRLELEQIADFRRISAECHPVLPTLVGHLLRHSMFSRLNRVTMGNLTPKYWTEYQRASIDERLDVHTDKSFTDYVACIDGYNPTAHTQGSDEELRHRIGTRALAGAKTLEEFRAAIAPDREKHRALIELTHRNWMSQIPRQLLVVSDTVSIFQDRNLFLRMIEQTNRLTKLRGSEIVPE